MCVTELFIVKREHTISLSQIFLTQWNVSKSGWCLLKGETSFDLTYSACNLWPLTQIFSDSLILGTCRYVLKSMVTTKQYLLILIIVQRDATKSSLFIILQVHSTCFGCQPRPSSRVHKTVTTASGTGKYDQDRRL